MPPVPISTLTRITDSQGGREQAEENVQPGLLKGNLWLWALGAAAVAFLLWRKR